MDWGDGVVIYHRNSGTTFVFESVPLILIQRCFLPEPFNQSMLEDLIGNLDLSDNSHDKSGYLESLIQVLSQKELIEPVN